MHIKVPSIGLYLMIKVLIIYQAFFNKPLVILAGWSSLLLFCEHVRLAEWTYVLVLYPLHHTIVMENVSRL